MCKIDVVLLQQNDHVGYLCSFVSPNGWVVSNLICLCVLLDIPSCFICALDRQLCGC